MVLDDVLRLPRISSVSLFLPSSYQSGKPRWISFSTLCYKPPNVRYLIMYMIYVPMMPQKQKKRGKLLKRGLKEIKPNGMLLFYHIET